MLLENRGVVVTGAASGLGRAIAVLLAAEGARVVVSDVTEDEGEATVDRITASGGKAEFVPCDITVAEDVDRLIDRSVEFLGGLDLAVNNAGIAHPPMDLHEIDPATFDTVVAVDLRGTFLCMRAELRTMVAAGHGSIVNIASNCGVQNAPDMAAYTAAKHGVVGLTKNAAITYAARGIRVNSVCPGPILTEGLLAYSEEQRTEWAAPVPMKRFGSAEEVARTTAFLLSDHAGYITGENLLVDGGLMYA
ncbi:MAG: fabG18 [Frankiales bacterium]|nr:fabG18 [Frankiales bacterium]